MAKKTPRFLKRNSGPIRNNSLTAPAQTLAHWLLHPPRDSHGAHWNGRRGSGSKGRRGTGTGGRKVAAMDSRTANFAGKDSGDRSCPQFGKHRASCRPSGQLAGHFQGAFLGYVLRERRRQFGGGNFRSASL